MNHVKTKKIIYVPLKENSCVFPDHIVSLMKDTTTRFDSKFFVLRGHI